MPQSQLLTTAFIDLTALATQLQPLIHRLSTASVLLSKQTLIQLNVDQLLTLDFPPEQFQESLAAVQTFLDQDWLHPFQAHSTRSEIAFQLHPFYCDSLEKTILLGTSLDWLNITDPLQASQKILQATPFSSLSPSQATSLLLDNINSLRTLYILVKGYLIPRMQSMLVAPCVTPQPAAAGHAPHAHTPASNHYQQLKLFASTNLPLIQKLSSILETNLPSPLKPSSLTIEHNDSHLLPSLKSVHLTSFNS